MARAIAERRRRLLLALVVVLTTVGAASDAASAQDVSLTGAEAAQLAREAATDDEALSELRSVTEVDGRPVDLAGATASLGTQRGARLEALAAELSRSSAADRGRPAGGDPESARRAAEDVLDDPKVRERDVPRPFRRPLRWLADRLRPVGRWLERTFDPVLDLPGGPYILGALLFGGTAALAGLLISRRSRAQVERAQRRRLVDPALDPADLERQAAAAGEAGDARAEVRLRYQAGLLRLARADRLVLRLDTTPDDAARQVGLPAMDRLTADFDEIVYGDRTATTEDAAARAGWVEVLGSRPVERVS